MKRGLLFGTAAVVVTAAGVQACKTPGGGGSGVKSIEVANDTPVLDQSGNLQKMGSVVVFKDEGGMVHYRKCADWELSDRQVSTPSQVQNFQLVVNVNDLMDPVKQKQELDKLQKYLDNIQQNQNQQQQTSGDTGTFKKPLSEDDCKETLRFYPAIPYAEYIAEVKGKLAFVEKADQDKLVVELKKLSDTIVRMVSLLEQMAANVQAQKLAEADYKKNVEALATLLRAAEEKRVAIDNMEKRRRIVNDIEAYLPARGPAGNRVFTKTLEGNAYAAILAPFDDRAPQVKAEYENVSRTLHYQYLRGQFQYVEAMEACSAKGMQLAGRLEWLVLNRFINGVDYIPGWDDQGQGGGGGGGQQGGQGQGQGQDQNPVVKDPAKKLRGIFWVGTYPFDVSYSYAMREVARSTGQGQLGMDPINRARLEELAGGVSRYLPPNFHYISSDLDAGPAGRQGQGQGQGGVKAQFGANYGWLWNADSGAHKAGDLLGQKAQALCVKNDGYKFERGDMVIDTVTKQMGGGRLAGSDFAFDWSRDGAQWRWAASKDGRMLKEWRQIPATIGYVCSGKFNAFFGPQLVGYNFHRLMYAQPPSDGLDDMIARSCEETNPMVMRGHGICQVNVCQDCINILNGSLFPCDPKQKQDADQKQNQQQQQLQKLIQQQQGGQQTGG